VAWRFFKTLLFTVLVPGTVAGWLPQWLLEEQRRLVLHPLPVWHYAGLAVLGAGVTIYLWCARDFMVKGLGTPAPVSAPKMLVINGLYRWVRNPMYSGVLLVILGQAIFYGSRIVFVYLIGVALLFEMFVFLYEEPVLRARFGEPYEAYRREERRWIPHPPRKPADNRHREWLFSPRK
jgi:protein-S-isoprenylcysteine O-methyltransferase Ste14